MELSAELYDGSWMTGLLSIPNYFAFCESYQTGPAKMQIILT